MKRSRAAQDKETGKAESSKLKGEKENWGIGGLWNLGIGG
jgi:hypothetical protein